MQQKKIPGIMGGMGPSATRDLYALIIQNTPANIDQDHLEIIIHSYPHHDRTAAILTKEESPLPTLITSAKKLKEAGADFVAVPCNTAHFFIPDIQKRTGIPFVDMIEETSREIEGLGQKKVGLLSTSATAKTGLYQKSISCDVVIPSDESIESEMEAIYGEHGIKAGVEYENSQYNKDLLLGVIDELKEKGAEAIILGCTELPLCLTASDTDIPLINPTEILSKAIIREATE